MNSDEQAQNHREAPSLTLANNPNSASTATTLINHSSDKDFVAMTDDYSLINDSSQSMIIQRSSTGTQKPKGQTCLKFLSNLGKDGDVEAVSQQVSLLIEEVDQLVIETKFVFENLQQMFSDKARPAGTDERYRRLKERHKDLMEKMRVSGLGGLPLEGEFYEGISSLSDLIDFEQARVQELYKKVQGQREGASIVIGALESNSFLS